MALGFEGSGTVVARARAIIEADTRGVSSGMKKGEEDFHRSSSRIEGRAHLLKQALAFGGVATGIYEAFHLIDKAGLAVVHRFEEQEEAAKQTEARLKSTGAVAGITAKQVDALATSIQNKSGVDKIAIEAGENMLLTFTNIRNEAGKGNDVFNQSTKTLIDMSVALKEDSSKAAIQLGKALNDPIKGMTALRRVGVQFTQSQQDQVKALVESGHGMEAQKLILKELNREFGGSAKAAGETLSGALARLKFHLEDAGASVVKSLTPGLEKTVGLIEKAMPTIDRWSTAIGAKLGPIALTVFGAIYDHLKTIAPIVEKIIEKLAHYLIPVIQSLANIVRATFEKVDAVFVAHQAQIMRIVDRIGQAFKLLAAVVVPILKFVFTQILPRVIGIALDVIDKITEAIMGIAHFVRNMARLVSGAFTGLWSFLESSAYKAVLKIIEPFSHLPFGMGKWAQKMKDKLHEKLDDMKTDASTAGTTVGTTIGQNMLSSATPFFNQLGGMVDAAVAGGAAANPNAKGQDSGTAFGLMAKAKSLGSGSGGKYVTGGGHGGIAKPGTALDCSGFVYQVFTQNGFESFPGTSETQWSTADGPNWTSEVVSSSSAQVGDVVFMVGSPKYASPGHVGIVTDGSGAGAQVMSYYSTGRPAHVVPLNSIGDLVGLKRFYLVKKTAGNSPSTGGKKPPVYTAHGAGDFSTPTTKKKAGSKATPTAKTLEPDSLQKQADDAKMTSGILDDEESLKAQIAWCDDELANTGIDAKEKIKLRGLKASLMAQLHALQKRDAREKAAATKSRESRHEGADTMRSYADMLTAGLPYLSDATRSKIKPLLDELKRLLGSGFAPSAADYAKAKTILGKIKTIAAGAVNDATTAVDDAKSKFEAAFSRLAERADQLFDAQTARAIQKMRVTVKGAFSAFDYASGDLTPAERALKSLQDAHDAAATAETKSTDKTSLDEAQKALGAAKLGGDAQAIAQAQENLKQAQAKYDEDLYNEKVASLQREADVERAAADDQLKQAQDEYQMQRDLQRQALDDRLADLKQRLEDGKITLADYQGELAGIFSQYGITFDAAGAVLGDAFAQAFTDALAQLAPAINALISALNSLSALTGGKTVAPVSPYSFKVSTTQAAALAALKSAAGGIGSPQTVGGKIPGFATGGLVTGPTLAMIGEGGSPELVIPIRSEIAAQLSHGHGQGHVKRLPPSLMEALSNALSMGGHGVTRNPHFAGGDSKTVVFQNTFEAPPEDPFLWISAAKAHADAKFG